MKRAIVCAVVVLVGPSVGSADQYCGKTKVAESVSKCPDGSIPVFFSAPVQPQGTAQPVPRPEGAVAPPSRPDVPARPAVAAAPPTKSSQGKASGLEFFFGVWRTSIPGAVWTSPTGYDGTSWLHVAAGVSAGDLIIKPDGTYVWNSYGGKKGRWERGDAESPIVLVDTVENRRWNVSVNSRKSEQIFVWDGFYHYEGRR
jgi:hypothetical protein